MQYEIIGIIGTIFVLVSFLQKSEEKIRKVNIIGASFFVIYGITTKTYSTAVLNAALLFIHITKLNLVSKIKNQVRRTNENTEK